MVRIFLYLKGYNILEFILIGYNFLSKIEKSYPIGDEFYLSNNNFLHIKDLGRNSGFCDYKSGNIVYSQIYVLLHSFTQIYNGSQGSEVLQGYIQLLVGIDTILCMDGYKEYGTGRSPKRSLLSGTKWRKVELFGELGSQERIVTTYEAFRENNRLVL